MYPAERQRIIGERALSAGRVEVAALSDELRVAAETVRRDLAVLQRRGVLRRVHGGAVAVERQASFERDLIARTTVMTEAKRAIAGLALAEVPDEGAVFVEGGSTQAVLADLLPGGRRLTVVTTGLPIAMALAARPGLTVLTVGGRVRGLTLAEVDDWALRSLREVHVDVAFVGTNGLSARHGLTTPDSAEASVKRAALGVAGRTVLLADHTKVGAVSLCRYGSPDDVDLLITDDGIDPGAVDELAATGLAVRVADPQRARR